jgi:hypothetical protein
MTFQEPKTVYRIRDWDRHFEVAQTRKVDQLQWLAVPLKHDGLGFRRVMALPEGIALYGAWALILQVAAKCRPRGVLVDASGPMTAQDLALKTGGDATVFEKALNLLSEPKIGWLLVDDYHPDTTQVAIQDSTKQNNTNKESTYVDSSAEFRQTGTSPANGFTEFVFPTSGKGAKQWSLSKLHFNEYVEAYPGLDIDLEMRKARQWAISNPKKRKTPGGMLSFLTNWLNRAQNRGSDDRRSTSKGLPAGQKFDRANKGFGF